MRLEGCDGSVDEVQLTVSNMHMTRARSTVIQSSLIHTVWAHPAAVMCGTDVSDSSIDLVRLSILSEPDFFSLTRVLIALFNIGTTALPTLLDMAR